MVLAVTSPLTRPRTPSACPGPEAHRVSGASPTPERVAVYSGPSPVPVREVSAAYSLRAESGAHSHGSDTPKHTLAEFPVPSDEKTRLTGLRHGSATLGRSHSFPQTHRSQPGPTRQTHGPSGWWRPQLVSGKHRGLMGAGLGHWTRTGFGPLCGSTSQLIFSFKKHKPQKR